MSELKAKIFDLIRHQEFFRKSKIATHNDIDDLANRISEALTLDRGILCKMISDNEHWVGRKEVPDALHVEKKLCNFDLAKALANSKDIIKVKEN